MQAPGHSRPTESGLRFGRFSRTPTSGLFRRSERQVGVRTVRIGGELHGPAKRKYFQEAAALLHPVACEEPFGLVYLEALASGIPVLTLARATGPFEGWTG